MQTKKSLIYRLFRFFLWSGIGIVVLLFVSYAVITSRPGLNYLKKIAQNQLSALLDQQVVIEKIRSNLFTYLEIENAAIYRIEHEQTIPLLSFSSLHTSYRLLDLLAGKITIKAISIDSLHLNVKRDSMGVFNLPIGDSENQLDEPDSPSSLALAIRQITINHATLDYQDQQSLTDVAMDQFNFTLRQTSSQIHEFNLQVGSVFFRHQDINYSGKIAELSGVLTPQQWAIQSLRVDGPGFALTGRANVLREPASLPIEGKFTLSMSLDSLNQPLMNLIPEAIYPISGNVNINVDVSGSVEAPVLDLALNSPDVRLADYHFSNVHFQGKIQPDIFQINQFSIEIFNGVVGGSGYFHQDSARGNLLDIKLENLQLADLWKTLYQELAPVSGFINGNLRAAGPGFDFQNWEVASDFSVHEFAHKSKLLPPIQHQLLYKNQTAQFYFQQGKSEITITGKLHTNEVDGVFTGKISEVEPLAELFNINEVEGMLHFSGTFSGNFDQPELYAKISGDSI
ncbi:MAG: AsmA family protein, partial [bacterium]|nr:AsmA family protein [bacterium]